MKIVLVFVSSLDGKVTKWGDPKAQSWSSENDKRYFAKIWQESKLIIMGSKTFQEGQLLPSLNHLIVILTGDPLKYKKQEVTGQLEFTSDSPLRLADRFEKEGYKQMLVVGGPQVATSFLKVQLIDELWLTIEPRIFGTGHPMVADEKLDISLRMISCEKVNEKGTLITRYAVLKTQGTKRL